MTDVPLVLIVEDDRKIVDLLRLYLDREGFPTIAAYTGTQALELFERHAPGFVILDLMLPALDGLSVCRTIRERSSVPILMLTARAEEADTLAGLAAGADDYVTKPFSPREVVARVRAILRRAATPSARGRLVTGPLHLDPERHEVSLDGRLVNLTPTEFKLLQTLMEFPGRAFTRDQLLTSLYAFDEAAVIDRTIDVHIGNLRQKLRDDPVRPKFIATVRGVGYKLVDSR